MRTLYLAFALILITSCSINGPDDPEPQGESQTKSCEDRNFDLDTNGFGAYIRAGEDTFTPISCVSPSEFQVGIQARRGATDYYFFWVSYLNRDQSQIEKSRVYLNFVFNLHDNTALSGESNFHDPSGCFVKVGRVERDENEKWNRLRLYKKEAGLNLSLEMETEGGINEAGTATGCIYGNLPDGTEIEIVFKGWYFDN